MTLRKFGQGEVLPEDGDLAKEGAPNWTPEDSAELAQENEDADGAPPA